MSEDEKEYPFGWVAIRCSCKLPLIFPLEHYYKIGDLESSYLHGECPNCGKVHNIKVEIEVWKA